MDSPVMREVSAPYNILANFVSGKLRMKCRGFVGSVVQLQHCSRCCLVGFYLSISQRYHNNSVVVVLC